LKVRNLSLIQSKIINEYRSPLLSRENILDKHIRAYTAFIFDKPRASSFGQRKSFSEKLKSTLKGIANYGTEAVSKAYAYIDKEDIINND